MAAPVGDYMLVCTQDMMGSGGGAIPPGDCAQPTWVSVPESSPFALDVAAANALSLAILGVWAIAWVFRTIARQLSTL